MLLAKNHFCLFLTWYINEYIHIYTYNFIYMYIPYIYIVYTIYVCIHALYIYIHLVSNVVKLATASTVWTMQPAFPRIRLRDSSVGKNDHLQVVKVD